MLRRACLFLTLASVLPAQSNAPAAAAPVEEVLRIPEPGRFQELFRPFRTDNAAISPDGKYLAYSVREADKLFVFVLEIDHPEKLLAKVQVADDEGATPMLALRQTEQTPARINWLGWTTPARVVVETNRVLPQTALKGNWLAWRGEVLAFDADGGNAKVLMTPKDSAEFTNAAVSTAAILPSLTGRPNDSTGRPMNHANRATADQPADDNFSAGGVTSDTDNTAPNLPQPEERLTATVRNGAPQSRTVRILDFDQARPGAVLVVVTAPRDVTGLGVLALYSLDTNTGKLKPVSEQPVSPTLDRMLDRQGLLRLTVSNSLREPFPHLYEYSGLKGADKDKSLESVTGIAGFSVSPANYFGKRAIPLGFDDDPNVLYYAANTGRDTYGVYSVNLATKQRGHLAMEHPSFDLLAPYESGFPDRSVLVFDRFQHQLAGVRFEGTLNTTAWTRPGWAEMQAGFEKAFPGRSVKITDWDQAARRLVVTTEGPSDPGAFYIYDGAKGKLLEFVRRAPWIDAVLANPTTSFVFAAPDGARLSGLITAPRQPRLKPIPVVVLCPDLPWQRVRSDFQAEVQALADMGFVVVQLNGRGAWGLGLKQRQSLTAGYDQVQVEDIVTTLTALGQRFQINSKRIALMGRGHGGFIALRALQSYPDKFRCAIALDAPVNLRDWISEQRWTDGLAQPQLTLPWFGDAARLKAAPLSSNPEALTKPVLMLNYPGSRVGDRRAAYTAARYFGDQVRRHGTTVEFGDLTTDYMNGLPVARAAVFDRIEEFLNLHIYDFKVKVHETQMAK